MFRPKFMVRIFQNSFPKDNYICLGTQLLDILTYIQNDIPPHIWYVSDVTTNEGFQWNLEKPILEKIGSDSILANIAKNTEQFFSGVFLAINNIDLPNNAKILIEAMTDRLEYSPIDLNGVILEIRAFDTTYFEIFTEDLELIDKISKRYNTKLIYKK